MFYTNVLTKGNKLYHIGYNDNGDKFVNEEEFISHVAIQCDKAESTHKTIYGEPTKKIEFNKLTEYYNYIKKYKSVFPIYNNIGIPYQFIHERYKDEIDYDITKMKIFFYDIETLDINDEHNGFPYPEDAPVPVVSIVLKDYNKKNIYVLSMAKYYDEQRSIDVIGKVYYNYCSTERELLNKFLILICKLQPDILSGWNSDGFDDPYIINRIGKVLGNDSLKKLSPCRILPTTKMVIRTGKNGRPTKTYYNNLYGISTLDMLKLFVKYYVPTHGEQENYKLDHIASVTIDDNKIPYDGNLLELFNDNPQKFVEYNIQDVEILDKINTKFRYIELQIYLAYYARCNFSDVFSPVKTWEIAIYNYLNNINQVTPNKQDVEDDDGYEGAYVKEPIPGIYKWVVSYDAASLYPSLIMQFGISPDLLITKSKLQDMLNKVNLSLEKT